MISANLTLAWSQNHSPNISKQPKNQQWTLKPGPQPLISINCSGLGLAVVPDDTSHPVASIESKRLDCSTSPLSVTSLPYFFRAEERSTSNNFLNLSNAKRLVN